MSQQQQSVLVAKNVPDEQLEYEELGLRSADLPPVPALCGIPLKYISLVTLAVQNSLLTIIMHYSRVHIPPSQSYSAPMAVLLNELLKGAISLAIAFTHMDRPASYGTDPPQPSLTSGRFWHSSRVLLRSRRLAREVFSPDCWKLSIPAILYVIQNNLQYVAATNLEAATFQVSYQMKILTTAAFSVLLLRKQLSASQWVALFFLAIGVGIVQIQTGVSDTAKATSSLLFQGASMNAVKGFLAVVAACFTSGLAGVYFEMVLKNSQSDLWIRNVQLSAFSLLPALVPIILARRPDTGFTTLFQNFGGWAWATVAIQVFGGLVTAMVIKYSDNILKGFATSLSIVISFLASVALFDFRITFTFILGSVIVLIATWLYNQPNRSSTPLRLGYTAVKT
ncbi:nucleotide-sugar transporter [Pisolithus thermaeus]|nr:nucleotide-sugar transporter [Pisolithus croceorrhizus]KAI6160011.1 nucleotide-sugar transporter [Pisolithus thermaeus]